MRLLDRIALNRTITLILNFILKIIDILSVKNNEIPDKSPKPKVRKIKNLLDNILPWRSK